MLALVKTPRIELSLAGNNKGINEIIKYLQKEYQVEVLVDSENIIDEAINVFDSELFADIKPGEMVASYRLKHGLTQKELAEKSGITQTNISAYESGKRNLTRKAAEKLATALGENADKFFMIKK